jgi:predicted nucleotide-binding protein
MINLQLQTGSDAITMLTSENSVSGYEPLDQEERAVVRSKRPEPQSAQLTVEQMKSAIPKLARRISDLEGFDVSTIRRRFDPIVEALANKVDGTLQEILGHGSVEYNEYTIHSLDTLPLVMGGGDDPLPQVHKGYQEGIERATLKLKTLKELFEERVADASPVQSTNFPTALRTASGSRRIFVVHGHDDGTKETVARYLTQLGVQPIILHEQPNQGRTVIEKFEAHADVEYAVVIFTPDDIGYPKENPDSARPRARQNVVLELGFFWGTLSCVLFKEGVEMPSDYSGVLYVLLDDLGKWRFDLAREMKSAGMTIDLNKAV